MNDRPDPAELEDDRDSYAFAGELAGSSADATVRVHAAALYVALLKAHLFDEATEFAEWYLDTFDHDLED